ncbi:hypothetical protein [Hyphococcus sp.]|uniref:hypothetical protein n=1 Tax=Hyphococcus sp. TaxID=2038636 RepID=UPI003CCBE292
MLFRFAVSLFAIGLSACATSSETAHPDLRPSFAAPSLANFSRVEIAQNYKFKKSAAPVFEGGVLRAASSDLTAAHDDMAKLPENYGSRIQNLGGAGEGEVIYHRTQSAIPDGWADNGEALVHLQSGLSCQRQINIDGENRHFVLDRITQFDDAGRDVACGLVSNTGGAVIAVFASYWPDVSRDDHALSAAASIIERYNVSEELPAPIVTLAAGDEDTSNPALFSGLEEPIAGGFSIGQTNGVDYKTAFWIAKTFDWHVKVYASYPKDDITAEIVAAVYFAVSHLGVRAKNLSEPTAPGVDV